MFIHELPEAKQLFTSIANEKDLTKNLAFNLEKNKNLYGLYRNEFAKIINLFFSNKKPTFDEIYNVIIKYRDQL